MIWVYAICERPDMPPPRRRGLAQAPLDSVREGELLAVVSRHVHPPGEPALDALWVHERVVERLMADRAVLPMRFGSRLPDDEALRDVLARRQESLAAALDRVRGRVELGVRAMHREPPAAAENVASVAASGTPGSGREYLLGKLRDGHRAEHAAAVLHEPLSALSAESRRQAARGPDEVLRASYLVERTLLPRFRTEVQRLQRTHPEIAVLCTGPWPPYSFVDGADVRALEPSA